MLPGIWMLSTWPEVHDLADDKFVDLCQRVHLKIGKDLSVTYEVSFSDGTTKSASGTLTPWIGRLIALSLDDKQFLGDVQGMREDMQNDYSGLPLRVHKLMALTPRNSDLLVGYDVQSGQPLIFVRCPAS